MPDLDRPSPTRPTGQPRGLAAGEDATAQELASPLVRATLAQRYITDVKAAIGGHVAALVATLVVMWAEVPHRPLLIWAASGLVGAALRAWLRNRAAAEPSVERAMRLMFMGTLIAAVFWSVGTALACIHLDATHVAMALLITAGLTAASTGTLVAHPPSFYLFASALLGAGAVSIPVGGVTAPRLGLVLLVVVFGVVMVAIYRRSHGQLISYLITTGRLVEVEERLRRVVDTARDLIWEVDADGRWTYLSPAVEEIYGGPASALLGRSFVERIRPDYHQLMLSGLRVIAKGDELRDRVAVHVDLQGHEKYLSVNAGPLRDDDGTIIGAGGTARDITERVEREQAIAQVAQQGQFLRLLINNTPDLIFYKDGQGVYRGCNHAFAQLIEQDEAAILGHADAELYDAEHAAAFGKSDDAAFVTRQPVRNEELVMMPDGRMAHLETVKTPFFTDRGERLGLLGISRDVTDRKETENRMRDLADKADRATRMKSAFLANMSHEIRTPMNGLLGMLELLIDTDLTPEQKRLAEVSQTSAESLLSLLNDILDFSKIEAGHLELEQVPFDVTRVLAAAVRLMAARAEERHDELLLDIRPDMPTRVIGDPGRIRQVMTNLVSNAIKFTENGEVVVEVSVAGERDGNPLVTFAVRDTGIGIPLEKQRAIFEEFAQADVSITRRYGGTGLGLSISTRLVTAMGGQLEVQSEVGKGSTFFFTIPLTTDDSPVIGADTPTHASLHDISAIVVDDNATNRRIVREFLEGAGSHVEEAASVTDALARMRAAVVAGTPFDLAVLDLLMPDRSGFDMARDVGADAALHATHMMILTSAGVPGDSKIARDLGIGAYMSKPVSRFEFLWAASALLARTQEPGAPRPTLITRYQAREALTSLNILLAEDGEVNQQVASAMLRKRGHLVDIVDNGRKAVEAVRAKRYDVVLMDVQMPELDGIEATKQIRGDPLTKELPIVAVTAHAFLEERERCFAAGMNGFLSKPFKAHELFAAVEGWSGNADTGASGMMTPTHRGRTPAINAAIVPPVPVAAAAADGTLPVDLAGFRALMREAGVESIVDETIAAFLREAPVSMDRLRTGIGAGDAKAIASAAHALKGASGSIRATRLAAVLEQMEAAGKAGDLAVATALAADTHAAYSEAIESINAQQLRPA